jgi:hypothetical protein
MEHAFHLYLVVIKSAFKDLNFITKCLIHVASPWKQLMNIACSYDHFYLVLKCFEFFSIFLTQLGDVDSESVAFSLGLIGS